MEKARRGMVGIYQLKNVRTGEQFIGSAPSFGNHFRKHLNFLALGKHPNFQFQELWDRDGPEYFEFSVLETIKHKYELRERERYWIEKERCSPISAEAVYAHEYASPGVGRLTISRELKKQLKLLDKGAMDQAVRGLMDFYSQHSKYSE